METKDKKIEVRSFGKKLCEIDSRTGMIEIVEGGMMYRIDFLETIRSGKASVDRRSAFTRFNSQAQGDNV